MSSFPLYLLRHGEPEGAGRLIGRTDAPPTAAGIAACADQARDLAAEVLIASDLSRARLAGEAIGLATDVPLSIDPRWRGFGTIPMAMRRPVENAGRRWWSVCPLPLTIWPRGQR